MQYTIENLLEHPTYFHRLLGYAFRDSRYLDVFGVARTFLSGDNRIYAGLNIPGRTGVLCYVNDFEMVHYMPAQGGVKTRPNSLWTQLGPNEPMLEQVSAEYTKLMLCLNLANKEEFYHKYTLYKIARFTASKKLPTDERKIAVAAIKKECRQYLASLERDIYRDAFTLMLDRYFVCEQKKDGMEEFDRAIDRITTDKGRFSHVQFDKFIQENPQYVLNKNRQKAFAGLMPPVIELVSRLNDLDHHDERYARRSSVFLTDVIDEIRQNVVGDIASLEKWWSLVDRNRDVVDHWLKTSQGKRYAAQRKKLEKQASGKMMSLQLPEQNSISPQQNIVYYMPQFSSLNEQIGSCKVLGLDEVDYEPVLQGIMDAFVGASSAQKDSSAYEMQMGMN